MDGIRAGQFDIAARLNERASAASAVLAPTIAEVQDEYGMVEGTFSAR